MVDVDIEVESTESFPISEEIRIKAQSLREQERKKKEQEEKRLEREREKWTEIANKINICKSKGAIASVLDYAS
ncbi:hypothetical protein ACSQ67_020625 [Phaseolus vulgaris]